jgi:hypothetical protein
MILVVEDKHHDILLVRRAFAWAKVKVPLHVVTDGDLAVQYLSGAEPYEDRQRYPPPALVLLDLHLPRRSGHEDHRGRAAATSPWKPWQSAPSGALCRRRVIPRTKPYGGSPNVTASFLTLRRLTKLYDAPPNVRMWLPTLGCGCQH